jgi:hypothetical protein
MTSDDLVSVLEDLLESMTVADMRAGIDYKPGSELSDVSWGILVRFIGGERPTASEPPASPPGGKTWDYDADGTVVPARHNADVVPARQNTDEPLVLGGQFDGIELP